MKLRISVMRLSRSAILLSFLTAPVYAIFPPPGDNSSPENSQSEQAESHQQQALSAPPLESRLGEAIDNSLQPFSGSILLTQKGKPLLNMHKGRGINQQSSFVIASLSKQITATLILQAVDAGKLQLDRSLNSYRFQNETRLDNEENWDQEQEIEQPADFNAKFETRQEDEPETDPDNITEADEDALPDSATVALQGQAQTTHPALLYGTSIQTSQEQRRFNPN